MSNPAAAMSYSFDNTRASRARVSSSRFQEAARSVGGVLTGLGNALRKTTAGMALAGLTAFLANTAFVTSPANAQTITLQTDCSTYQPNVLGASGLCVIEQDRLATEQNKLAHQREQQIDRLSACITQLVDFKKRDPNGFAGLKQSLKIDKVTDDNACTLSGRIPKPTAAKSTPSAG
ncbi:MAG TPA: hypothetical protein VHE81_09345 [Lacipirellulaceae bacterium]|nr:hypothetical protein [Lacipirellulaceae bacterium]